MRADGSHQTDTEGGHGGPWSQKAGRGNAGIGRVEVSAGAVPAGLLG